jgi:NAD(P)-dependent dehydrogenase (short-subunit alcohol dehydrogenase family)
MPMPTPMSKPALYPSLDDSSVFITGGSSGIGACMVRRFAEQGARVAFVGLHQEAGESLLAELAGQFKHTPVFTALDLRDIGALQAAIEAAGAAHGPIAALVNNAADDTRHTIAELTPDYWDDRVAVNLRHMVFAAQEAAKQMRARGGGAIVNLGSIAWKLAGSGYVAYATCKAGVHGLTRSLARELGPDNIRANTVSPGWVMTERQLKLWVTPEGEAEMDKGQCLKARLGPEDIAAMTLFLCAEDSRYCTSQDFTVDAGWT